MNFIFYSANPMTKWFLACMVVGLLLGLVCVKWGKPLSIEKHRRLIDSIPQILSTLGVLGTFMGITQGLLDFNVDDINGSIPKLLDGLKTAFFTSICGMTTSAILRFVIDGNLDTKDNGLSDMQTAQVEICKAIQQMSKVISTATEELSYTVTTEIKKIAATQSEYSTQMIAAIQDIQKDAKGISELDGVSNALQTLQTNSNNLVLSAQGQNSTLRSLLENYSLSLQNLVRIVDNTTHLSGIHDVVSTNSTAIDEGVQEIKSLKGALHGEVIEIEEAMHNTNNLLTEKFDEFSELLKKSNTDALVEVMKGVSDEFSNTMKSLIEKLVQENFEQLNKSVERLNVWQQENKEMITSLIAQYRQMAQDFDGTSTALTQVSEDTQRLISRGGTLSQLIETLKSVMIDDVKFVQIANNLTEAATLTKNNMQSFDDTTNRLNEWVRKQYDFNNGVKGLIAKLDELNKIRDYGEQFWQDTKRQMGEGIGILQQGTKSLDIQIRGIDERFYARLGATLSQLDSCISAMVEHYNRN